jgi:dsRNA-specific ribonuclease
MSIKNQLQELCQKKKFNLPSYDCEIDYKKNMFKSIVVVDDCLYEGEWKKRKKDSEISAAEKALIQLKKTVIIKKEIDKVDLWIQEGYQKVINVIKLEDTTQTKFYVTSAFLQNLELKFHQLLKLMNWIGHRWPLFTYHAFSTLGDSVLKCQQTLHLIKEEIKTGKNPSSFVISQKRTTIESREYLSKKMLELKLEKYIISNPGLEIKDTKLLGEFLESLIGIIYLLEGETKVQEFIINNGLYN